MPAHTREELEQQTDLLKEEYIKLLNDKDVLLNWGKPQLEALYATRIGIYLVEQLQMQLHIKALKRKIEMVQSAINREMDVDINAIELQVAQELIEAEFKIMQETGKIELAKDLLSHLDTPERSAELRKLYKQMAKRLHPDVNPELTDEQIQLWHLIKEAYENGDLEKIKALQVVYEKELNAAALNTQQQTDEALSLQLATLKEGIRVLQEQLLQIRSEFPFTIEKQIKDDEWVALETTKMKEEIKQLMLYEEELTLQYQNMISVL